MMKRPVILVLSFLILAISAPLFSQTADKLEVLLGTPALTWEQAADFVQEASSMTPGGEQNWLPKNVSLTDAARLNNVALLLMQSFDLKGGIFYTLLKSPHHAYRELVYKKVIRGSTDPDMSVSGSQLLLMVSRILAIKGES